MTLTVHLLNAATGEQTELPHVDPSPLPSPGLSQSFPPCTCPRCLPRAAEPPQDEQ